MKKIHDLTNMKFEKLTVIHRAENNKHGHICWLCRCDCGNEVRVSTNALKRGNSKSCGCSHREATIKSNKEKKKKYNVYRFEGNLGIGITSNSGDEFYFDSDDYDKIKTYCWSLKKDGYIYSSRVGKYIALHRLVMDFPKKSVVDHLNRNKRDNRKENLNICKHQKNMLNQVVRSNNSSGVTGVTWDVSKGKWHSYVMINKKLVHLGFFDDIKDAIYVRLKSEKENGYSGANVSLWKEYGIED